MPIDDRLTPGTDADEASPWFEASILELEALMVSGGLSSVELTEAYLRRIERLDPLLHAVIETSGIEPADVVSDESPLPAVPTRTARTEDLSSLTVLQLRSRARDAGHAGFSRYTKAQLLALLSS